MTDYNKPLVYNPRLAEDRIAELEAQVEKQNWAVMKLKAINTDLLLRLHRYEQLIDTQHKMLDTYNKIFKVQDAELKKLREGKYNETN